MTKIFDAIAQTLDGMIVELRGSTETDKKKLTEALLATRKLSHDIRTMIKVKSRIFRANYDRPQKRQLEELEGISAELEKIADEHESLAGTSGVVMSNGLKAIAEALYREWEKCLRNASGTTAFRLGGPLKEMLYGGARLVLPLIIPSLLTAALTVTLYSLKDHQKRSREIAGLVSNYKERLRACKQFGEKLTMPHTASEYQFLRNEMTIVIDGGQSGQLNLAQVNWNGIVERLGGLGIKSEINTTSRAIGDLKIYFLLPDLKSITTNSFSTNDFYPLLDKATSFLNANSLN
ncbi:MAG TPA: hypothetical protein VIW67_16515 [Terriglobales bacterium]